MKLTLPRVRIIVLATVAALTAWSGYLWLRSSSLVRVDDVTIKGVHGRYSRDIKRTLESVGRRMTTMHMRESDLEKSVALFPVVHSVSVSTGFPNHLKITVREYVPVARVTTAAGRRVAVASDGTLLPRLGQKKLPTVTVKEIPSSGRLQPGRALQLVGVLAGTPRALRPLVVSASFGPGGVRAIVRGGPIVYFGSPQQAAAKWISAARVIGDVSARGARFVDVRVAERPVVGTTPPAGLVSQAKPTTGPTPTAASRTTSQGSSGASATSGPGNSPQPSQTAAPTTGSQP
jgi:cell division protein FtsQ